MLLLTSQVDKCLNLFLLHFNHIELMIPAILPTQDCSKTKVVNINSVLTIKATYDERRTLFVAKFGCFVFVLLIWVLFCFEGTGD